MSKYFQTEKFHVCHTASNPTHIKSTDPYNINLRKASTNQTKNQYRVP